MRNRSVAIVCSHGRKEYSLQLSAGVMKLVIRGRNKMASSKEYLDFIMDQLSDLEEVTVRGMANIIKKQNHLESIIIL